MGQLYYLCVRVSTARLAQSVEHETLNLRVVGSSPTLGEYSFFFYPYLNFTNFTVKLHRSFQHGAMA